MYLSSNNRTVLSSDKKTPLVELDGQAKIVKNHKHLNCDELAQLNVLVRDNYFKIVSNPNVGVL